MLAFYGNSTAVYEAFTESDWICGGFIVIAGDALGDPVPVGLPVPGEQATAVLVSMLRFLKNHHLCHDT